MGTQLNVPNRVARLNAIFGIEKKMNDVRKKYRTRYDIYSARYERDLRKFYKANKLGNGQSPFKDGQQLHLAIRRGIQETKVF